MILYDRLWDTMDKKGLSQYRLIKYYQFSSGQLDRLRKNEHVSTHTLEVLCMILGCEIQDLVEFKPDDEIRAYVSRSIDPQSFPKPKTRTGTQKK